MIGAAVPMLHMTICNLQTRVILDKEKMLLHSTSISPISLIGTPRFASRKECGDKESLTNKKSNKTREREKGDPL